MLKVRAGSTRNGRFSLFLLPAACSVDIIAVHVSPTATDWLDGRDQQKVTGVKLAFMTKRFRLQGLCNLPIFLCKSDPVNPMFGI